MPTLQRIRNNQSGRLLVDAAMTMPVLLLFTVFLLGLGYLAYQKALLVHNAFEWTERAAYVWKDSHKDPVTGGFSYEEMDDVYQSLLTEGFGFITASLNGFRQAELTLPDRHATGPGLQKSKLLRSSDIGTGELQGKAGYYNRLLEGEIRAEWKNSTVQASGMFMLPSGDLEAQASSHYSDPVEFLRTIYLVQEYSAKLKERFTSPKSAADQLAGVAAEAPKRTVITNESQAKAYLKQLIGGESAVLETRFGDRHINVLDNDRVAHEAKYTVNKTDAKTQIKKDAELIRTGAVTGVVWHFFPKKDGKYDLTPALREELEQNGIMVVLHR